MARQTRSSTRQMVQKEALNEAVQVSMIRKRKRANQHLLHYHHKSAKIVCNFCTSTPYTDSSENKRKKHNQPEQSRVANERDTQNVSKKGSQEIEEIFLKNTRGKAISRKGNIQLKLAQKSAKREASKEVKTSINTSTIVVEKKAKCRQNDYGEYGIMLRTEYQSEYVIEDAQLQKRILRRSNKAAISADIHKIVKATHFRLRSGKKSKGVDTTKSANPDKESNQIMKLTSKGIGKIKNQEYNLKKLLVPLTRIEDLSLLELLKLLNKPKYEKYCAKHKNGTWLDRLGNAKSVRGNNQEQRKEKTTLCSQHRGSTPKSDRVAISQVRKLEEVSGITENMQTGEQHIQDLTGDAVLNILGSFAFDQRSESDTSTMDNVQLFVEEILSRADELLSSSQEQILNNNALNTATMQAVDFPKQTLYDKNFQHENFFECTKKFYNCKINTFTSDGNERTCNVDSTAIETDMQYRCVNENLQDNILHPGTSLHNININVDKDQKVSIISDTERKKTKCQKINKGMPCCPVCSKRFETQRQVKIHAWSHTRPKRVKLESQTANKGTVGGATPERSSGTSLLVYNENKENKVILSNSRTEHSQHSTKSQVSNTESDLDKMNKNLREPIENGKAGSINDTDAKLPEWSTNRQDKTLNDIGLMNKFKPNSTEEMTISSTDVSCAMIADSSVNTKSDQSSALVPFVKSAMLGNICEKELLWQKYLKQHMLFSRSISPENIVISDLKMSQANQHESIHQTFTREETRTLVEQCSAPSEEGLSNVIEEGPSNIGEREASNIEEKEPSNVGEKAARLNIGEREPLSIRRGGGGREEEEEEEEEDNNVNSETNSERDSCASDIEEELICEEQEASRNNRKWHCKLCNENFALIRNYLRHKYYSHNDETIVHICDNCTKVLTSVAMVNIHVCVSVKTWACRRCNLNFDNALSLTQHNMKYHFETVGPHNCNVCKLSFLTKYMLEKHKSTQHAFLAYTDTDNCFRSKTIARSSSPSSENTRIRKWRNKSIVLANHQYTSTERHTQKNVEKLNLKNVFLSPESSESVQTEQFSSFSITYTLSNSKEQFNCEICSITGLSKIQIQLHLTTQHNIKVEECQLCGDLYIAAKVINHLTERHIVFDNIYLMGKQTTRDIEENLAENNQHDLLKILGPNRLLSLQQYQQFASTTRDEYINCAACAEEYLCIQGYAFHQVKMHDMSCILCNTQFKNISQAVDHKIKTHSSITSYLWAVQKIIAAIEMMERYRNTLADITLKFGTVKLVDEQCLEDKKTEIDRENVNTYREIQGNPNFERLECPHTEIGKELGECSFENGENTEDIEQLARNDIISKTNASSSSYIDTNTIGDINIRNLNIVEELLTEAASTGELSDLGNISIVILTENDLQAYKNNVKGLVSRICSSCKTFSRKHVSSILSSHLTNSHS